MLIVPYGIETKQHTFQVQVDNVLIVPYGIETQWLNILFQTPVRVNCTLWN